MEEGETVQFPTYISFILKPPSTASEMPNFTRTTVVFQVMTGCKEIQLYSLPSRQAVASMY